jgi:hypothetical protein
MVEKASVLAAIFVTPCTNLGGNVDNRKQGRRQGCRRGPFWEKSLQLTVKIWGKRPPLKILATPLAKWLHSSSAQDATLRFSLF